jgi:prolipoprotein diacylglyceryltransferase
MLYEMLLEGFVLFLILWIYTSKPRPLMAASGLFVLGYGVFRSLVEFIRLPDANIGYLFGTEWLTMGMLLSVPLTMVAKFAAQGNENTRWFAILLGPEVALQGSDRHNGSR